jgi:hypothetical protein
VSHRGFLEEFNTLTNLSELNIDCEILLRKWRPICSPRLPDSIQRISIEEMTGKFRLKLLRWLEALATDRLRGSVLSLEVVAYSIRGDHIPAQVLIKNH